jgi:hypothetical protein
MIKGNKSERRRQKRTIIRRAREREATICINGENDELIMTKIANKDE